MPADDPLQNPDFKAPGLGEKLREAIFGLQRPFDCLQIEVTSHCGYACIYCPHTTQKSSWKSRNMDAKTFAAAWPLLRRSKRAHLQGWGEPFLHPRFFDFASLAIKAGCDVSTTTSGLVMDKSIAEQIVNSGMDIVAFSLVGTDARTNDARQKTDFNKVCENIKFLRQAITQQKKGPELHIAYLALADRLEAMEHLPELMDNLDVEMAVISTLDYLALPEQKHLAIDPANTQTIENARNIMRKVSEEADKRGRLIHFSLPNINAIAHSSGCRENTAHSLYIDAEGSISPCVYLNVPGNDPEEKRRIFGNVLNDDPLEIWRKESYAAFRNALQTGNPDAACLQCPKRYETES